MKTLNTASKPAAPFFARKVDNATLVVQTGVRAGAHEADAKARESCTK